MGNRVRNGGQQLLWACMCRDRFSTSVDGHKEAELIRECRPPVPYLNGDYKETVTCSSLLFV